MGAGRRKEKAATSSHTNHPSQDVSHVAAGGQLGQHNVMGNLLLRFFGFLRAGELQPKNLTQGSTLLLWMCQQIIQAICRHLQAGSNSQKQTHTEQE